MSETVSAKWWIPVITGPPPVPNASGSLEPPIGPCEQAGDPHEQRLCPAGSSTRRSAWSVSAERERVARAAVRPRARKEPDAAAPRRVRGARRSRRRRSRRDPSPAGRPRRRLLGAARRRSPRAARAATRRRLPAGPRRAQRARRRARGRRRLDAWGVPARGIRRERATRRGDEHVRERAAEVACEAERLGGVDGRRSSARGPARQRVAVDRGHAPTTARHRRGRSCRAPRTWSAGRPGARGGAARRAARAGGSQRACRAPRRRVGRRRGAGCAAP